MSFAAHESNGGIMVTNDAGEVMARVADHDGKPHERQIDFVRTVTPEEATAIAACVKAFLPPAKAPAAK